MITLDDLWENEFKGKQVAYDFAGRKMVKSAKGDRKSDFGWDIDHIWPKSKGGSDEVSNLQITNIKTNAEKNEKTVFKCNRKCFESRHINNVRDGEKKANYNYKKKDYCLIKK